MSEEMIFKLNANNSNGSHNLHMVYQDEKPHGIFFFTLTGQYKGEDIQIDFDELTVDEMDELIIAMQLVREEAAKAHNKITQDSNGE